MSKDSTLYVGSFEMNSSKDKMYHFANGYIDIEQGHVKAYCYYAKDHLGNVRHIDMANPNTNRNEIVQVNNYYPFGGVMDEGSRRGADEFLIKKRKNEKYMDCTYMRTFIGLR